LQSCTSSPHRRGLLLGGVGAGPPIPLPAGRLRAWSNRQAATPATLGSIVPLGIRRRRDALAYAPPRAEGPLPLLLLLHGATQGGEAIIEGFSPYADRLGFAILAPQSWDLTWPVGRPLGGSEIAAIDAALAAAYATLPVDPARIAIAGFSDGATYALSLGLANGGLFSDILAFSPGGFEAGGAGPPRPRVFLGHGRSDSVLPFGNAEAMVRLLRRAGYDVAFHPFDGGHVITASEAHAGLARFLGTTAPAA
jgi:predicted esterase